MIYYIIGWSDKAIFGILKPGTLLPISLIPKIRQAWLNAPAGHSWQQQKVFNHMKLKVFFVEAPKMGKIVFDIVKEKCNCISFY